MHSPAGSETHEAQAARMREDMRSPSEYDGWESPLRGDGEFGSQSPAFSEPLSSPASPTQQNKPFLLNAKEYVIQFYGVVIDS